MSFARFLARLTVLLPIATFALGACGSSAAGGGAEPAAPATIPPVAQNAPNALASHVAVASPGNAPPPAATSRPVAGNFPAGAMIDIPAGTFMMGADDQDDLFTRAKPVHEVGVAAFAMDVSVVTVAAYRGCVEAGKCSEPKRYDASDRWGRWCTWGQGGKESHPVNCVDWDQAVAYCAWVGKRLPTEEEWEYAARGTDGRKYPWGNAEPSDQLCWKRYDSKAETGEGTCPAGSFTGGDSPFGLRDMAGNVWQWTSSGYSSDYGHPRSNNARVNRGGGWSNVEPRNVRSANRSWSAPSTRETDIGIRCAR